MEQNLVEANFLLVTVAMALVVLDFQEDKVVGQSLLIPLELGSGLEASHQLKLKLLLNMVLVVLAV